MVKVGYASTDKDKKKGETSTGSELKITKLYNFGQDTTIRFNNSKRATKCIEIIKYIINSGLVGYSQSRRYTLWNICVTADWDFETFKKMLVTCDTDCSQLIACVINLAYGKLKFSKDTFTGNMILQAKKLSKHFNILKYNSNDIKRGDLLLKEYKHVVMSLNNSKKGE